MMMSPISWSELHDDLLILITKKLQFIKDIVLFRSVCVSWRSASKADSLDGTRQLPWLLLDCLDKEENVDSHNKYLCDFTHKRPYETTEFSDKYKSRYNENWYLGWKGWFVVEKHGTMCLRHAFKKTTPISLPNLPAHTMVRKAVLSSDPFMNASDYILAIIDFDGTLALWRPGDESYTRMQVDGFILDAVFHGGLLYATSWATIYVFDVAGSNPLPAYQIDKEFSRNFYGSKCYLVEMGGDIMLSLEFTDYEGPSNCQFEVFLVSECSKWKEVKDLGNKAIFIGANSQSFALDNASEIQGCMPNHIYFTYLGSKCDAHVYAYNLANGKVDFFCAVCEEDFRCFQAPLWVQPVFD